MIETTAYIKVTWFRMKIMSYKIEPERDKTNKITCPSALASAQSEQSLRVTKDPKLLHADSADWPNWANTQTYLRLRRVHMSLCWFCRAPAHYGSWRKLHLLVLELSDEGVVENIFLWFPRAVSEREITVQETEWEYVKQQYAVFRPKTLRERQLVWQQLQISA